MPRTVSNKLHQRITLLAARLRRVREPRHQRRVTPEAGPPASPATVRLPNPSQARAGKNHIGGLSESAIDSPDEDDGYRVEL